MTATLVALLVFSAVAEVFGTVTVAISYVRGHRLALRLLTLAGPPVRQTNLAELLDELATGMRAWNLESALAVVSREVGNHLQREWWLSAGLVAYVIGALAGLAAGLLAILH